MNAILTLRIPEPCSESWSGMEPTEKGRHCRSCSRELIDFTRWSDSRIIDYLENNEGRICGRLSSRQLNRNLLPEMQAVPASGGLSLPALVLLAVTMTAGGAFAAEHPEPAPYFSLADFAGNAPKDTIWAKTIHSGTVIDRETGEAIPLVKVSATVAGAVIAVVQTDIDGKFSLEFSSRSPQFTLTIESPGFDTFTTTVTVSDQKDRNVYKLTVSVEEIQTIGYIVYTKEQARKNRRASRKAHRQEKKATR